MIMSTKTNANMSANEKSTNQHFFNSVWMLCNDFEVHYFYFSHHRKPNVPSSSQVRKTNVNKQRLFLALSNDLFAVFAGGSEVIAASLDRQFHASADFVDLSAASLDSTLVFVSHSLCFWTPYIDAPCWEGLIFGGKELRSPLVTNHCWLLYDLCHFDTRYHCNAHCTDKQLLIT